MSSMENPPCVIPSLCSNFKYNNNNYLVAEPAFKVLIVHKLTDYCKYE